MSAKLDVEAFTIHGGQSAWAAYSNCLSDTLSYIGQVEDLLNRAVATLHFAIRTYGEAEDKARDALKLLETPNSDTSGPKGVRRMLGLDG